MRSKYSIVLFLVVMTLAVYWRAGSNGFINLDDPSYVTVNPHVQTGFTFDNVRWAFTSTEAANWHPLTWLSHMLDCQLYGLNPRGHHFTSIFIHIANTVLLFLLFTRMTGALWRSACVAALFALHPLHVESVAWVAERKDVLSTLFFMGTLFAYARYAERPGLARYVPVICSFALGLMAKPMLVTLPFVLLLLDYWPLGRYGHHVRNAAAPAGTSGLSPPNHREASAARLLLEKVPLFLLSVVFSLVAIHAQKTEGAMILSTVEPITVRLANAVVAYARYIGKMVWPDNLAVFYPFPSRVPLWQVGGAVLALGCASILVMRRMNRSPYLLVGWLWFLGTLVPVIGLVQVGGQAMADRYTYIPLIGLFIMIAWGAAELTEGWRHRRLSLAVVAAATMALLSVCTWQRLGFWRNSVDLFTQTLAVTRDNIAAHINLGYALDEKGRRDEAMVQFYEALRINPNNADVHRDLADILSETGRVDEAVDQYRMALRIHPGDALAHKNLGIKLLGEGKTDEAIAHFSEAVRIIPANPDAHFNLGVALSKRGQFEEAANQFSFVLRMNPYDIEARNRLELALAEREKARGSNKR